MQNFSKAILAAVISTFGISTSAQAETPRIISWNINGGEQDKDILAANAEDMQLDLGTADILVLQEVISLQQVAAVAERLGYDNWAISDFSPPVEVTGKWFRSLEVAILSREPFVNVAEWDTTGNLPNGDAYDPRTSDMDVSTESLALGLTFNDGEAPSRGFLRVDLESGLSVYAVHWKSSGGKTGDADLENAAKRENNARGVAADASSVLASGRSVVVAGDYNIQPIGKHVRVGSDVLIDCVPSASTCGDGGVDGYDDSMQILSDIGNGYRLLSDDLPPTYLRGDFGPGAIDHIAVAGPLAGSFAVAETVTVDGDSYFGSDHSPVISGASATLELLSVDAMRTMVSTQDAELMQLVDEVRERLDRIEKIMATR